jgi:membrane protease YdiL (CAAX protease family)
VKRWPIIAAVGLLALALIVEVAFIGLASRFISQSAPNLANMPWSVLYFGHTGVLLTALVCIALIGHGHFDVFGFKLPRNARYVWIALLFGIVFGLVMTVADYAHNLAAQVPPEHVSLSGEDIAGRMTFSGLYAGTVEEILFRGLLLTFLVQRMSGRVRLGKFDVHIGGIIVAALFALAHLASFWTENFATAAAQQVYAFVWAIMYAYWYEKSGSLLPSIVGHNVGNLVEELLLVLMAWRWS